MTAIGAIHVRQHPSVAETYDSDRDTRLQQWAAHGNTLYYFDSTSDDLYRWRIGQTSELVAQPITSVIAFAVNPAETQFVIAGDYDDGSGTAINGVWLVDAAGGTPRRIDSIDASTLGT